MQVNSETTTADTTGQPAWLATRRRKAHERGGAFAPLTGREEIWRYTDMSLLETERYGRTLTGPGPAGGLPESAEAHWKRWNDGSAHAALVDGGPVLFSLPPEASAAGVTLMDLDRAAKEQPELLRLHLGTLVGAEDRFTAQSLAQYRGGLFIHVPRRVRLSEPLRLQQWIGTAGALIGSRVVVVVEPGAEVSFSEDLSGDDLSEPSLFTPVLEIFVGAGAQVTWQTWQQLGTSTHHLAHVAARLERDAHLTTFNATFGADFSRTTLKVDHAGEGARSTLLSAYFPTGSQHMEHWTVQDLKAPHAQSDLLYKGAVAGAGHSVYYGTIRVGQKARATASRQTNRNLLLSDTARADTNPQLEIDTNDVRCSHGSSVGQLAADQLFYAMSRGLDRKEAERMLVTGFLVAAADGLGDDEARGRVEKLVRHKLKGEQP